MDCRMGMVNPKEKGSVILTPIFEKGRMKIGNLVKNGGKECDSNN